MDNQYPAYQPTSTTHPVALLVSIGADYFKEAYEAEVEKIGTEIQSLVEPLETPKASGSSCH